MVLLYRHARTASTEIYAGLRRGFWLPHCVQTAVYLSSRGYPSLPPTISDLSVGVVYAAARRRPVSWNCCKMLYKNQLRISRRFSSCHGASVSAIIHTSKLMETWGAETNDEQLLLRNLAAVCHQQETDPRSSHCQLSCSVLNPLISRRQPRHISRNRDLQASCGSRNAAAPRRNTRPVWRKDQIQHS